MMDLCINGLTGLAALPLIWLHLLSFKFNSDNFLKAGKGCFFSLKTLTPGLEHNSVGSTGRGSW